MKIQFRTKFFDVVSLIWISLTRSPRFILFTFAFSLIITWSSVHDTIKQHGQITLISLIALVVVSIIIFAVIFLVTLLVYIVRILLTGRNIIFSVENMIELQDDRFIWVNKFAKSEVFWEAIRRIVRTRKHIILFLYNGYGLIIPRRAFANPVAWEEFCFFVATHFKK